MNEYSEALKNVAGSLEHNFEKNVPKAIEDLAEILLNLIKERELVE